MRYFVINLGTEESQKYLLNASIPTGRFDPIHDCTFNTINHTINNCVENVIEYVRDLAGQGDILHLFPNLPCRRSYRFSRTGRLMQLAVGTYHCLERDDYWNVMTFSDARDVYGTLGEYVGYTVALSFVRYPDPWLSYRREHPVQTTATELDNISGVVPHVVTDAIQNEGSLFAGALAGVNRRLEQQRTILSDVSQTQPEPLPGYRRCQPGEIVYFTSRHWNGSRWELADTHDVGRRVPAYSHYCTPEGSFPDWIEVCEFNPAYRYLRKGEIIQRADVAIGKGGIKEVRDESRGLVVKGKPRQFARPIGVDGWRMMEPHEDPFDGAYEHTEYQSDETTWLAVPLRHPHQDVFLGDNVEFRRYVFGYVPVFNPSPLEQAPFATEWIEPGEVVTRATCFMVGDDGRLATMSHDSWFYAPCERRFCRMADLPLFDDLGNIPFRSAFVVKDLRDCPFDYPYRRYWFLTRFSLTVMASSGFKNIQHTIGTFYPVVFDVDGRYVLVFCTDRIPLHQLPAHLLQHLGHLRSAITSLASGASVEREELVGRHLEI